MPRFNPPSHVFREYDIRGVADSELTERFAYYLGICFGERVAAAGGETVMVAYDGRLSSPALAAALMAGLAHAEIEPLCIGLGPTPMLYHSVCAEAAGGGVMITGSHNPSDQNGFKMMLGELPFYGSQIQALREEIQTQEFPEAPLKFAPASITPYKGYLDNLLFEGLEAAPLHVVWDSGNGATGEVVEALAAKLPGTHTLLNTAIDGTFPAHHPDPSEPKNMAQLIAAVKHKGADMGIAFDGDGDRIGVVDAKGRILAGDQLLILFALDLLNRHPDAKVIGDVKSSQTFAEIVSASGGHAEYWKTGHSNIKSRMKETGALLAGEMSGHLFFAEDYFGFDDAVLAAVRLLALLKREGKPLATLLDCLPASVATPEIRIPWAEETKFDAIASIAAQLKTEGIPHLSIDGVRVITPDGWWLLRASNTQAILVARAESSTAEGLKRLQHALEQRLNWAKQLLVQSPSISKA